MVVAFLVGVIVAGWRTRQTLLEVRGVLTLATDAQDRLEKLHFQRTETRGYAGTLGGPMGSSVNVSGGQSLTEQMMTMPELVDDYCDFVERVVAALGEVIGAKKDEDDKSKKGKDDKSGKDEDRKPGKGPSPRNSEVRLVIGIDEMDQIEDVRGADVFLTELQSVFGTSDCVYLISISPKALAASDELGVPTRNSANAIFDELVWVDPLELPKARELLNRRVIGLPDGFIKLCYVLSGGLPKDLLRIARTVSAIKPGESGPKQELAHAVAEAITDELEGFAHRAMADAASLKILAAPDLLKLLSDKLWQIRQYKISGGTTRPVDIRKLMDALSRLWAGEKRQQFADAKGDGKDDGKGEISPRAGEICDSFLAGLYFLLTVRDLFGTRTLDDKGALRDLAGARAALDLNPYLAAAIISDTRKGRQSLIEPAFLRPSSVEHAEANGFGEDSRGGGDVG